MLTAARRASRRATALLSVAAITAALVVIGAGTAHAGPSIDDSGTWTVDTAVADATITGFGDPTGQVPDLVIPDMVTVGGNPYRVAVIAANAFRGWGIASVTLPPNLSSVLSGAFLDDPITKVTITGPSIPAGLGNELPAPAGYIWSASTIYDPAASWRNLETDGAPLPGTFYLVSSRISQRDDDSSQWRVSARDGEASIDGRSASNTSNDLTIPASVNIDGASFPVTEIGRIGPAFQNAGLTSAVIPDGVVTIWNQAFEGNSLTSLAIPDSVTEIHSQAFAKNKLSAITIPSTVTLLGAGAFEENEIASATLPSGIKVIPDRLFDTNKLTAITIPDEVTSIGQFALSGNLLDSVAIPASVTDIGYGAFSRNDLSAIEIPNTVTSVGPWAFGSNHITSASLSDSLTEISPYLFASNQLSSISLPTAVTDIGEGAFYQNNLVSVVVPDSVTQVDRFAFQKNQLTSAALGSGLTTIGAYAFAENQIPSLTLPDSVSSIDVAAFYDNNIGGTLAIPDGITSIADSVFQKNRLSGVVFGPAVTRIDVGSFAENAIAALVIPDSVTEVGDSAFYQNSIASLALGSGITKVGDATFYDNRLTALTVPSNVTVIGDHAFQKNRLTTVDLGKSVATVGATAFYNNQLGSIVLPASVTAVGADAFTLNPLTKIEFAGSAVPAGMGAAFVPDLGSAYDRKVWSPTSSFDPSTTYKGLGDPAITAPSTIYLVPRPSTGAPPALTVTPAAPSFHDADVTYTIPSTEGIEYRVGDTVRSAGRWPASTKPEGAQPADAAPTDTHDATFLATPSATTVVVTARVVAGYELADGAVTSWSHTYKAATVTPGAPDDSRETTPDSQDPELPALTTSLYRDFAAKVPDVEVDGQGGAFLTDRVAYTGLTVGAGYSVVGHLVYDDGGDTGITGRAEFKAETAAGSVPVVFHLSPSEIKRGSSMLVAFEVLTDADSGTRVASHEDLSAEQQQISLTLLSQSTNIYFGGDWYPNPMIQSGLGAGAGKTNTALLVTGIGLLALLGTAGVLAGLRRRRSGFRPAGSKG